MCSADNCEMTLALNRLSGDIPSSFQTSVKSISRREFIWLSKSEISKDSHADSLSCGSKDLNQSLYAAADVLGLLLMIFVFLTRQVQWKSTQLYQSYVYFQSQTFDVSEVYFFDHLIQHFTQTSVLLSLIILLLCFPAYIYLKSNDSYSTHTHAPVFLICALIVYRWHHSWFIFICVLVQRIYNCELWRLITFAIKRR